LTGDAAATDPVCRFSPEHGRLVRARDAAAAGTGGGRPGHADEFAYRTMRAPAETVR
jgi:pyrroloquinoline quinone biosynthesis protein E